MFLSLLTTLVFLILVKWPNDFLYPFLQKTDAFKLSTRLFLLNPVQTNWFTNMAFKLVYNPAISNAQNVKALSWEPAQVPDGTIKSNMVARKDLSFWIPQVKEVLFWKFIIIGSILCKMDIEDYYARFLWSGIPRLMI